MQDHFAVTYSRADAEWERAAAERFNPEAQPVFDHFYGYVQISVGSIPLFDNRGYSMSVADLACGLADILRRHIPIVGGDHRAVFEQSDDALQICFERHGERLRVSSNRGKANCETSVPAFMAGTKTFLRRFAHEAVSRVPAVLDWKDLEVLRPYEDS